MTSQHTLRHFRAGWFPELIDRNTHEVSVEKGSRTLGDRVNKKVRKILETHVPKTLPDGVKAKLETIIANAEQRGG